jgi:hypothetical protein
MPSVHLTHLTFLVFSQNSSLDSCDIRYPVPDTFIVEGNKRIGRMMEIFGLEKPKEDSKKMMHLVASYFIVKSLMPVRLGLSLGLSPLLARGIDKGLMRIRKKFKN